MPIPANFFFFITMLKSLILIVWSLDIFIKYEFFFHFIKNFHIKKKFFVTEVKGKAFITISNF